MSDDSAPNMGGETPPASNLRPPWKPGQSGNPAGRPPEARVTRLFSRSRACCRVRATPSLGLGPEGPGRRCRRAEGRHGLCRRMRAASNHRHTYSLTPCDRRGSADPFISERAAPYSRRPHYIGPAPTRHDRNGGRHTQWRSRVALPGPSESTQSAGAIVYAPEAHSGASMPGEFRDIHS